MIEWTHRCHRAGCDQAGMTTEEYHEHIRGHQQRDGLADDADGDVPPAEAQLERLHRQTGMV